MNNIQRIICCCVSAMLSVAYIVPQTTCVFAQEVSSQDEAQPFTATLDDDFIANKLALMFKYDFTKQDIETTIAPKLIEAIGGGKLKEFEYLDTVNIDDENSRQMNIALLDPEDTDKQSAYEIAVELYETGYFYSVEVNMVGIPSITETTTTTTTTFEETTTTTTTEAEKITDIEQIREMFTKFIADNELDAKCVSDEAYPQYAGTVVIEFNSETAANTAILEYAEKSNIERTAFNLVPCVDGKPITTTNPDAENTTTTTTTTTTTDGTNTDLPQTGNNSVNKLLIAIAALMLTATGAGAVYYSGILRRKEDDK